MKEDKKGSVVIPVYNQYESLMSVLKCFSIQNISKESYEVIVIDDGSEDQLKNFDSAEMVENFQIYGQVIHQSNKGRAIARNVGIEKANNEVIVFCDGDRFPRYDYISQHLKDYNNDKVVIGVSYDYFGKSLNLCISDLDWIYIQKYSRIPKYQRKISSIFNGMGETQSNIRFMSFLVGNSCVSKEYLNKVGGFDPHFIKWGFEHFELALRFQEEGLTFKINREAKNYHIPHPREKNFYQKMLLESAQLISSLHPEVDANIMLKVINDEISIEESEKKVFK